ncbi:MAG TPA: M23 family metallopeptidase [Noviherbaspirillum sp.]
MQLATTLRTLFFAVCWSALLGMALPLLENLVYLSRLASMHAPASLAWPVGDRKTTALHDTWHAPRPGGRRHEGIDLFSPRGTPVRATTEGILIRRASTRLGGKVVWVLGPGGQKHYYAHLDRFAHLAVGERVHPGTILGYVGNTGNARTTPPHLHYGIYTRTGPINPYRFFAGRHGKTLLPDDR